MKRILSAAVIAATLTAGCSSSRSEPSSKDAPGVSAEHGPGPAKAAKVEVAVRSWDEVEAFVAKQSGKAVVIDFWSTW